ncbi:MAG: hypothetical protein IT371_23705 [Deltaproteobacteria bacterium]|nr:hypothetical protein [Deltaproteobacteria bacterium]
MRFEPRTTTSPWTVLEAEVAACAGLTGEALLNQLRELRAEAEEDPEGAVERLSELGHGLRDAGWDVERVRDVLRQRIAAWVEVSCSRLETHTNQKFEEAIKAIDRDLDEEVGYGTQFGEMYGNSKRAVSSWWDKRAIRSGVARFFDERLDDPNARRFLEELVDKRRSLEQEQGLVRARRKSAESTAERDRLDRDIASLRNSVAEVQTEVQAIRKQGLARMTELERRGFFQMDAQERIEVLRRFDPTLIPTFRERGWLGADDQAPDGRAEGLLGRLLEGHFGESALTDFRVFFQAEDDRAFAEYWSAVLRDVAIKRRALRRFDFGATARPEAAPAPQAVVAIAAVAMPLAAAGVLAAGWHTVPWALLHLGAPLALVGAPVAVWAVVTGKEKTREALSREARVFAERWRTTQLRWVHEAYRHHATEAAGQFVDDATAKMLVADVGATSIAHLGRLLDAIDSLCAHLAPREAVDAARWSDLAQQALDAQQPFAAAALCVSAYESVVHAWLDRLGRSRSGLMEGMSQSLAQIAADERAPTDAISRLRRLRPLRNRWAHGMRDLVGLSPSEVAHRVRKFLLELELASPR